MTARRLGIIILITIISLGALIFITAQLFSEGISTDDPVSQDQTDTNDEITTDEEPLLTFPRFEGTDLLLETRQVPNGLSGEYKLMVVAYDDEQQPDVNSWLDPLETLNEDFPQLAGYYVPLLPKDTADSAFFIIGGMSLVAENDRDRQRTIIVFTDIDQFNKLMQIDSRDEIQLFLLNANNQVIWQTAGSYNAPLLDDLSETLSKVVNG